MTSVSAEPKGQLPSDKPKGLFILPRGVWPMAFTEFWERFSFYGLQGILSFYLLFSLAEGGLALNPASASSIIGAYGGCVYLAQLVGAWLGERILSPARMVALGAIIIMAGHLTLAFVPSALGLGLGLGLIVVGTGALKTNITSIVGFMADTDRTVLRDGIFAWFYMAISFGALIGGIVTASLQTAVNFHAGFAAAAVGMGVALVIYLVSWRKLPERARVVAKPLPANKFLIPTLIAAATIAVIVVLVLAGVVNIDNLAIVTTGVSLAAVAFYFSLVLRSRDVTSAEKRRVAGYFPMFSANVLYYALIFQEYTAFAILVAGKVDPFIGSWEFPVAALPSIAIFTAVIITPFVVRMWQRQGERQPTAPAKFGTSLLIIGLAFVSLVIVIVLTGEAPIPVLALTIFMIVAGCSEIFIGPIGLSLITDIAPNKFKSQLTALNFLTLGLGASLAGVFGQVYTIVGDATVYFVIVAATGLIAAAILFLVRKPLNGLLRTSEPNS